MKTKLPHLPETKSRLAMKLGPVAIGALLIASCVVTAVHPFYTTKDLTFDPALLGQWASAAEREPAKETWTFEQIEPQTYQLITCSPSETNSFDTRLFTLGKTRFLDCYNRARPPYAIPTHVLLRVDQSRPQLILTPMNYEWLAKLVEQDSAAIRHTLVPPEAGRTNDGGLLVLTADTAELQSFVRRHLANTNAWSAPIVLHKL
jgi:hypothetical protein